MIVYLSFIALDKGDYGALQCKEEDFTVRKPTLLSFINEVLYFDYYPQSNKISTCVKKIFTNCELLQSLTTFS